MANRSLMMKANSTSTTINLTMEDVLDVNARSTVWGIKLSRFTLEPPFLAVGAAYPAKRPRCAIR